MDEFYDLDENTKEIVEAIGEAIIAEEAEPQIVNVYRLMQMIRAYREIKAVAWPSWKISYSLHSPYKSMGVISVEAAEFTFENIARLQRVFVHASNIEIYPLIDGSLKMNITFHGITRKML